MVRSSYRAKERTRTGLGSGKRSRQIQEKCPPGQEKEQRGMAGRANTVRAEKNRAGQGRNGTGLGGTGWDGMGWEWMGWDVT